MTSSKLNLKVLKASAFAVGLIGISTIYLSNQLFYSYAISVELAPHLFIFLPYTVLSLLAWFVNENNYRRWLIFSVVWIPLQIFTLLVFTGGSIGGDFSGLRAGYNGAVILLISGLYFLIGLGLIALPFKNPRQ